MRASVLYGWHPSKLNFASVRIFNGLREKQVPRLAIDHINSPTFVGINDIEIILVSLAPGKVWEYYGDGARFGANITYIP